ncbi:MAG: hypothetical protein QOI04_1782 [Verrucomicrobiota bacterium]|jgi:Na+/melibiose symporter-like transporter
MENASEEKPLKPVSFVVHATRGVIRDQKVRRKMMLATVLVALILSVAGSTILQPLLNPREHRGWFIAFWFVCAWITILAALLAVFDLLMLRLQKRTAEKTLREELPRTTASASSILPNDE